MTRIALFPGTFDPLTLGHLDIIKKAPLICDQLIVAIAHNSAKKTLFSLDERLEMLHAAVRSFSYVKIDQFTGLTTEYAHTKQVKFLLRGVRSFSDFENEMQMAFVNRQMSHLETVFLVGEHPHLSSTLIRELVSLKGKLEGLVPPEVERLLRNR